ncbi:MAG: NAD(P)/FAD-dependent oxidoreductase [Sedimentibacter sp.]|uniref:NAD(P)/FAD-dependent oxidoreductase n=1 Tax=Sedimentibacter sp. TaxID=1960295 RepID=UPI003157F4B2
MKYDVIVVGAGPAGMFCASNLRCERALIIEKNQRPGKKLLLSGAGQCNYTNSCSMDVFLKKYGEKGRFLKSALYSFSNNDAMEFFRQRGIESAVREDGKVFPASFKSSDIVDCLEKAIKDNHVESIYGEAVLKISRDQEKNLFLVRTSKTTYACENLVVAAGGKSYPNTGSTGDGYDFARELGHSIENAGPVLTPVYVEHYPFRDLAGISFENIVVSLWRNNKKINEFKGDLLFTHVNVSGPVILNNSRYMERNDTLKINFTSHPNGEEFKIFFENMVASSGKMQLKTVLKQLELPKRFADKLMAMAGIDDAIICSQLDKNKRKKLTELLCSQSFTIEKLGDYHMAMATKGGVSTDEINQRTMESKKVPGLYFAGEVVDFDGDTGGFNIQAAFSTGYAAAQSINKKLAHC